MVFQKEALELQSEIRSAASPAESLSKSRADSQYDGPVAAAEEYFGCLDGTLLFWKDVSIWGVVSCLTVTFSRSLPRSRNISVWISRPTSTRRMWICAGTARRSRWRMLPIDSAMATEVLEHCPEPLVVLKEIRRVMKPGAFSFSRCPTSGRCMMHRMIFIDTRRSRSRNFWRRLGLSRIRSRRSRMEWQLGPDDGPLAEAGADVPRSAKRDGSETLADHQELVASDALPTDSEAGNTMATGWRGLAFAAPAKTEERRSPSTELPLLIVRSHKSNYSETFIEDHVNHISSERKLIYGWPFPRFDESDSSVLSLELENQLRAALASQKPISAELQVAYTEDWLPISERVGAKSRSWRVG